MDREASWFALQAATERREADERELTSWKNNATAVLAALQAESGEQISQVWLHSVQARHEQISLQPVETMHQPAYCFKAQHVWQHACKAQSEGMIIDAPQTILQARASLAQGETAASDADVLEAIISQGAVKRDAVRVALTASAADPVA